jgi:hypothetical protein
MTAVADIIKQALRETNLIPLGVEPSEPQKQEAFQLLSTIVASVPGAEAGENLMSLAIGGDGIDAPAGFPWYGNQIPANQFVRKNTRLMLNLTDEGYVYLDPMPSDGARMGVVDCAQNLDLCPFTIYGNGRFIDGNPDVTLVLPGTTKEWVYREDLGQWVTLTPLDIDGDMPWPSEFDDMFIIMLSLRLNPRYGQVIHPASMEILRKAKSSFSARYRQPTQVGTEDALQYMTNLQTNGMQRGLFGDPNALFDQGYPY